MSDDVMKRAREWLRESSLRGRPTRPELTLLEVDALLAHLDGEPARLVAKGEEVREACARSCPDCKGSGFTMRVRECPFCNDSTHDHECPTDLVKWPCLCGAARIRAMPLDSTPLGDELAQVRKERDALKELGEQRCDGIGCDRGECVRLVVERDEATSTMSRAWAAWARAADAALKGGGG